MSKTHNRRLGLCGVALTEGRMPRFTIEVATQVRDELEKLLIDSGYFQDAPFEWVTVCLRYGVKNETEPRYQPINKRYHDLPLSIEVDSNVLRSSNREEMARTFERAVLRALIHAAIKYDLPAAALEASLALLLEE